MRITPSQQKYEKVITELQARYLNEVEGRARDDATAKEREIAVSLGAADRELSLSRLQDASMRTSQAAAGAVLAAQDRILELKVCHGALDGFNIEKKGGGGIKGVRGRWSPIRIRNDPPVIRVFQSFWVLRAILSLPSPLLPPPFPQLPPINVLTHAMIHVRARAPTQTAVRRLWDTLETDQVDIDHFHAQVNDAAPDSAAMLGLYEREQRLLADRLPLTQAVARREYLKYRLECIHKFAQVRVLPCFFFFLVFSPPPLLSFPCLATYTWSCHLCMCAIYSPKHPTVSRH